MKKLFLFLIVFGLTIQTFAQVHTEELIAQVYTDELFAQVYTEAIDDEVHAEGIDEVEISNINYDYFNDVGDNQAAQLIKLLEKKVAKFDLKNANFYEDEGQEYTVFFFIPQGKISVVYDREGEILRASEKFEDIKLPLPVLHTVVDKYPGWRISDDVYLVTYSRNKSTTKMYKLLLEKDGNKKRVKTDENGKYI